MFYFATESSGVCALSVGEVRDHLKEIDKLPQVQRLMYMLLLTTGVRRGECFGLQWKDVDFDNRVLRIERSVTYTGLGGISVGLPKTTAEIREIPVTESVLVLLRNHRSLEEQCNNFFEDAYLFHWSEPLYATQDPTYITAYEKIYGVLRALNASPHDLRHTCASLLIQSGVDIKSVQDILGHADASTTLNFYARSNTETMRAAANRAFEFD